MLEIAKRPLVNLVEPGQRGGLRSGQLTEPHTLSFLSLSLSLSLSTRPCSTLTRSPPLRSHHPIPANSGHLRRCRIGQNTLPSPFFPCTKAIGISSPLVAVLNPTLGLGFRCISAIFFLSGLPSLARRRACPLCRHGVVRWLGGGQPRLPCAPPTVHEHYLTATELRPWSMGKFPLFFSFYFLDASGHELFGDVFIYLGLCQIGVEFMMNSSQICYVWLCVSISYMNGCV